MTYAELQKHAREMTREQVEAELQGLARDTRFAAVVAWLEQNKQSFVNAGCSQKLAQHHGVLAHCQGSVYACDLLQGNLKRILDPRPPAKSLG